MYTHILHMFPEWPGTTGNNRGLVCRVRGLLVVHDNDRASMARQRVRPRLERLLGAECAGASVASRWRVRVEVRHGVGRGVLAFYGVFSVRKAAL